MVVPVVKKPLMEFNVRAVSQDSNSIKRNALNAPQNALDALKTLKTANLAE